MSLMIAFGSTPIKTAKILNVKIELIQIYFSKKVRYLVHGYGEIETENQCVISLQNVV